MRRKKDRLSSKLNRLEKNLLEMKKVLVAFSGGVDSALLLKVASDVLGKNVLAVIAASETYPGQETRQAGKLARAMKVRHRVIGTHELDNPDFAENSPLRCYHCKKELFETLRAIADEEGIASVLDGSNLDDEADFRPGGRAAEEMGVRSPLREAELTKADIRELSRRLGLPTWNKPSLACLASRFPYGTRIVKESLGQVDAAEDFLRSLGFGQVRVRHYGRIARIEISRAEFPKMTDDETAKKIVRRFKKLGYLYAALDLEGYRTGSMNEGLGRDPAFRSKKTEGRKP